MEIRLTHGKLSRSANPFRRALDYAFYDWTREMPPWKRTLAWAGILIQGYAVYAGISRSVVWPLIWPQGIVLYPIVSLLYLLGNSLMNGMLTSEFVRKTQLEADQTAARQVQQTLIPQKLEQLPGYEMQTFYKPFREVGGDYFDVIELRDNRTLFAIADVSGKGMAAALLAANIQALVRGIANSEADPLAFARQINRHLNRYTPSDRFATAAFLVLSPDSGELTYVNAGHNPPIVFGSRPTALLEASGPPLGMFSDAQYESRTAVLRPDDALLLFTDGLTDSMLGSSSESLVRAAPAASVAETMAHLKSLVDPKLTADDITILLVQRTRKDQPGRSPG